MWNKAYINQALATVVFIDGNIDQYEILAAGVIPGINTVILNPKHDGIKQITTFLRQNPGVDTVHIISHGTPGWLYLGNSQLNVTNINNYRTELKYWSNLNIFFYGCNVAAGDAGAEFINQLYNMTQSNISASTTKTGNAALGGNWDLELSRGEPKEVTTPFLEESLANYQGVLAAILLGEWDYLSHATAVDIVNQYIYAVGDRLEILDVSNPSNPILVSSYDVFGWGWDIEVLNNYAYVVDGTSGLHIIDIGNPTNPNLVGNYNTLGYAQDVELAGNLAYVADRELGVQIINISNPYNPTLVGSYNTFGLSYDVEIVGNLAYIADGGSGLEIINISNPSNPTVVGSYNTTGSAWDVEVVGGYAYVADYNSGLQIINISNPSNPTLVGSYDTPHYAQSLEIVGRYAYVADYNSGVQIIDISNPITPSFVGAYDTPGYAQDIALLDNYAYVADGDAGVKVINISTASNPTLVGSYNTSDYLYDVEVVGSYAYVTDNELGLQIINIGNPTNPTLIGSYHTSGSAEVVDVVGRYAYVADGTDGLQIIDISNPAQLLATGFYNTPGYAQDVVVVGSYAYIADGSAGLQIIDISNPVELVSTGVYNTPGYGQDVVVVGRYAYVADRQSGLQIIDISNPSNPTLAGSYDTPGLAWDVVVVGRYAYVADRQSGLQIIDIINPSNPTLAGSYDTPGLALDVELIGNYAYVADRESGLQIIDVSKPSNPIVIDKYDTSGWSHDLQIVGALAYVADGDGGLKIIDISEFLDFTPDLPPVITGSATFSLAEDSTVVGSITAKDPENKSLIYTIFGGVDQDLFSIDDTTGVLSFKSPPDFEDPVDANLDNIYQVTVVVGDGANSSTQEIIITVNDLSEVPVFTSSDTFLLGENNTTVGRIIATSPVNQVLTYTISDGVDRNVFNLNASTGVLSFKTAPDFESPLDVNLDNRYHITVTVTDSSNAMNQDITVTVTDITEVIPPATIGISGNNVSQAEADMVLTPFSFTVTREGNTRNTHSVKWEVINTGSKPVNPLDFGGRLPSGTITFGRGETSRIISFNGTDDIIIEPNETFAVRLFDPSSDAIITTAMATGTIVNDDTPAETNRQQITTRENLATVPQGIVSIPLFYSTSTDDNKLSGISLRLHYDSNELTYQDASNLFTTKLFGDIVDQADSNNLDNDATTNRYIQFQYTDFDGNWPNRPLPLKLGDFNFIASTDFQSSQLNLTSNNLAPDYILEADPMFVGRAEWNFDIDGNGRVEAFTDGIMIVRYMLGSFPGSRLTAGATTINSTRSLGEIEAYLQEAMDNRYLDIDGNGQVEALSDGIMIVRHMFGSFAGEKLTADVISPDATRDLVAIESYLTNFNI